MIAFGADAAPAAEQGIGGTVRRVLLVILQCALVQLATSPADCFGLHSAH